jgi:hypothetical protein
LRTLLGVVCLAAFVFGCIRWTGTPGAVVLLLLIIWGVTWFGVFRIMKKVSIKAEDHIGELAFTSGYFAFWSVPIFVFILVFLYSLI